MNAKPLPDSSTPGPDELLFLPLGGTGEIGMNLNLYGHNGKWLMVDLGVAFGEHDLPGIEVVMPDPDFISERAEDLVGLVLTHAHEDHLGAVPWLWDELRCPIFATPFTAALLRRKLSDDKILDKPEIIEVPLSGCFDIGPFGIELVSLTHSIPEPNAVVIRTSCGTVLHTGDWKIDPDPLVGDDFDSTRLQEIAEEEVLAMVCDSTNAMDAGHSGSELTVRENLEKELQNRKGRIAVACFASNVARLETVMRIAENLGRHVALVGRSMHRILAAARDAGYLTDLPPLLDAREAASLPRQDVLLLCTGSQGEPRAALSRMANDDHHEISLDPGDTVVFSSRKIPGNEKSIASLKNRLVKRGIEIVTDRDNPGIHVSGHPCRDELAQMYQWVRPKAAIPVHGESRHLAAHAALAKQCQVKETVVAENGQVIRIAPGALEVVDHVHSGRLVLDGDVVRAVDSPVLRTRRRMVYNGAAAVFLVVDMDGHFMVEPRISAGGLYHEEEEADITESVSEAIQAAVKRLSSHDRRNDADLREAARVAVRRTLQHHLGKRPVVDVQLVRMD